MTDEELVTSFEDEIEDLKDERKENEKTIEDLEAKVSDLQEALSTVLTDVKYTVERAL